MISAKSSPGWISGMPGKAIMFNVADSAFKLTDAGDADTGPFNLVSLVDVEQNTCH